MSHMARRLKYLDNVTGIAAIKPCNPVSRQLIGSDEGRWLPHVWIAGRLQIMLAETRHGKFTRRLGVQVPRPPLASQVLFVNFLLQGHERVNQSFRTRRTA